MRQESEYVLESAGVNRAADLANEVRNRTIRLVEKKHLSSDYHTYYLNLSDYTLIPRLMNLYKIELDMFGYPQTPFQQVTPHTGSHS